MSDEEKARAKERIFSVRDELGGWYPKQQRPELWNIYNGKIRKGESMRIFPISNWTEQWVAVSPFIRLDATDVVERRRVRYRTVGDMTCTAAIESTAAGVDEIVSEVALTRTSERGETRIDDKLSESAMEDRKRNGYF